MTFLGLRLRQWSNHKHHTYRVGEKLTRCTFINFNLGGRVKLHTQSIMALLIFVAFSTLSKCIDVEPQIDPEK